MSLIHGHIRMLRALGSSLATERDLVTIGTPAGNEALKALLEHMGHACQGAADALEKEEMDLLDRLMSRDR